MSPSRRPDAPRLIEWTGERCVPWVQDTSMLYEHLHRYLWAARLFVGRRVLDLGSGEGFGAAILAEEAEEVVGVDVDPSAIEHAAAGYGRPGLGFRCASALDLSAFESRSFDAVVAFEMIEHVDDHERVLAEIGRVLTDDGILVISTPDKELYREASGQVNSFHEHELSREEFGALLRARFAHVAMWGQRTITGSYLSGLDPVESSTVEDFFVERVDGELRPVEEAPPLFCVAVASNVVLPAIGRSSTLADYGLDLLQETARAHGVAVAERDDLLGEANAQIAELVEELRDKREEVLDLGARLVEVEAQLPPLWEAREALQRVEESVSWQALERGRQALYGRIGERSRLGRTVGVLLRAAGRLIDRGRSKTGP